MHNSILFISKLSLVTVGFLVRNGFGVCPEKDATEILSDFDHSTEVALATLSVARGNSGLPKAAESCFKKIIVQISKNFAAFFSPSKKKEKRMVTD